MDKKLHFLLPLLFFIFVSESVFTASVRLSFNSASPVGLILLLRLLRFVFAPIQSGISDFSSRKINLSISLIATLASLFLFSFSYLLLFVIVLGTLGNVVPLSRAALGDLTRKKDFRFSLALSICAIALGSFGPLHANIYISTRGITSIVGILCLIAIFISMFYFKDTPQKKEQVKSFGNEFKWWWKRLKSPFFLTILCGYFFSEMSFFQILFRPEDLKNLPDFFKFIPVWLGIGYYLGTTYLGFSKASDKNNLIFGFVVAFFFICGFSMFNIFGLESLFSTTLCSLGLSFGFGIFTPSLSAYQFLILPLQIMGRC